MGKPIRRVGRDIVDDFHHNRDDVAQAVQQLRNQKNPTMPMYDSTNFPDDPTEGQVVVTTNDELWWFSNGAWHTFSGADTSWPMWYECLHPQHLSSTDFNSGEGVQYDSSSGFRTHINSAYYRGFYAGSSADGDYLIAIVRLGPRGSVWNIQPILEDTSGVAHFEWAQTPFGEDAPDSGLTNPTNALFAVDDIPLTPPSWYHSGSYIWNGGNTGKKIDQGGTLNQMRIMGQVGDVLSANGTDTAQYTANNVNGGPGIWYLKITAVTHPVNISSILVTRQTVFDYSTV